MPFFNERESLPLILKEIFSLVDGLRGAYKFEVLLLDNHSEDGSDGIAESWRVKRPEIKVFRQSRNFGYQANILAGYELASGDACVQLDADGEDDPLLIKDFIAQWEKGFKVVYGVRVRRAESFLLTLQRKIFYRLLNFLSEVEIPPDAGDFRLVDRQVVDILVRLKEANPYIRGLLAFAGFRQTGVPYSRRRRYAGESKFSWFSYAALAWDGITSFSKKPLSVIGLVGLFFSGVSVIFLFVYFGLYAAGRIPVRGFTTLILCQLFFASLQLLSFGVIAVYVGRIFDEVKRRPRSLLEK